MSIISTLSGLVKGKVLVTALIGATFVGGAGVALAATPAGSDLVQHMTGIHATVTPTHQGDDADKNTNGGKASPTPNACEKDEQSDSNQADNGDKNSNDGKATPTANPCKENEEGNSNLCPGQPEAQALVTKFSLNTDSKSNSMKVICTLHDGTFQGTVNHALGYGEIDQLLTYAQLLAKKDNTTLTDSNVQMYVATALKNCGSTAVAACVNANVPDNHSNSSDNGNGHDSGKPTVTPPPHGDGKPMGTPAPHGN